MPAPHFQRYRLILEPLTPIHIGTGEAIDPFDYSISEDKLIAWDLNAVLSHLNSQQRKEFQEKLNHSDPIVMRKWLHGLPKTESQCRLSVGISSAITDELNESLNDSRRACEVHLLPRNPVTGSVYLPGSSIKGAIRTALIASLLKAPAAREHELRSIRDEAQRNPRSGWPGQKFEAAVMGNRRYNGNADLYRDPLRQLAISDIHLPADRSFISKVQIVKPGQTEPDQAGKILMYRELTFCGLTGQQNPQFGLSASSELRLFPQLTDPRRMGRSRDNEPNELPRAWTAEQILQGCREFYFPRLLNDELPRFVTDKPTREFLEKSILAMQSRTDEALIRVGRHSHFECVTLDGYPAADSRFAVAPNRGYGSSRTFVGGKVPLGWAKLRLEPLT